VATSRALHRQEVDRALASIAAGQTPRDLESNTLDFKEWKQPAPRDRDRLKAAALDLADACACLYNARGGTIVAGVDDDASGASAFVGIADDVDADDLRHRIWQQTNPALVVDVEERRMGGRRILLLGVEAGFELIRVSGKLRERIGRDCVPMNAERETRVRDERRNYDWSAEQSDRRVDDVLETAIEQARSRLREAGDAESGRRAGLERRDLLRECGVVNQHGYLNRAGALLFCGTPSGAPSLSVQLLRKRTPAGELVRPSLVLSQPLVNTLSEIFADIEAMNETTPVTLRSGVQAQIETIPRAAVREAVINAVAHRDYRLAEPVVIEHSPQMLVVTSPGDLVFGVTAENILTHVSKPRNRSLAEALRVLRLAERAGTGVDTMVRAMIRAGHAPPEIDHDATRVRIVLAGGAPVARIAALVGALPAELRDDTDATLVIHYLRSHATVDAHAIARVIQKTEAEAELVLRRLSDDSFDLLEPVRRKRRYRMPEYRFRERVRAELGTLLPYHRNEPDEIDRRVIAHLAEYPTISNSTVQNLLQVSMGRASTILRDLSDRRIIKKTADSPQRGPTVRYERGPKYSTAQRRRRS
jgi:ATP-dependent DNA helicase RecG